MLLHLACVLLTLTLSANAFSATEETESAPLMFMTADVWPWGYLHTDGQPAGLLSLFAERLAHHADLPLNNRVLPHQRLLLEFRQGQAGFTVLFENPLLGDIAESIGVVLQADIMLVANRDFPGELTLEGLKGKKLGYIRGTYYGEAFNQSRHLIKIPVYNLDQAIDMLRINRLDALISSDIVLEHSLLAKNLSVDLFRHQVITQGHAAHLYVSRRGEHPQMKPRLQTALEKMRRSGELDSIFHSQIRSEPAPRH